MTATLSLLQDMGTSSITQGINRRRPKIATFHNMIAQDRIYVFCLILYTCEARLFKIRHETYAHLAY